MDLILMLGAGTAAVVSTVLLATSPQAQVRNYGSVDSRAKKPSPDLPATAEPLPNSTSSSGNGNARAGSNPPH